ncbi:hypothetical protein DKX38_014668 [Salix brachista]|uniref:NADP-dependent oxidoreductase domain-containing protein n=1 Tax=Salix brachista TaxID=2182728 RepID=A0A5N5LFY4_9ROSI|nr:hypothetical protein DKX38_014668 [Salix brachista]
MAASLHHAVPKLTITTAARPESRRRPTFNSVRCCAPPTTTTTTDAGAQRITVKNGNDSLDICRVLNGMWQTSGGWGRIDRDAAAEAMLRYADAGLSTFDMADHFLAFLFATSALCLLCCSSVPMELLHQPFSSFSFNGMKLESRRVGDVRKGASFKPLQCVLNEKDNRRIVVVKNGKDSLDMCRVVNGMWQTSGGWGKIDRDKAVDAMLKYADAGLTTFDMAEICNELMKKQLAFHSSNTADGPAEDLYGIFINRIRRERPPEVLERVRGLTKWVPPPVKMTGSYVRQNIDISRKRMDVPSLDMLQFHWWDYSNTGYLDALKHLNDLKEEGKIKTVALTNFDTERLQIILENGIPVVSNQVQHSLVDMRPQQKMAELCQLTGVKLITSVCPSFCAHTYGTVMGGLLSEKFLDTNLSIPFAAPPLNTPSLQKYKRYKRMVDAWGGWSLFQGLLRTLKQVASKHGVSIATVGVKYILDQPAVAGSMVGVRLGLAEHIQDTNAIFSLVLDEDDMNSIREATAKGKDLLKVIGDCGDEYRRI